METKDFEEVERAVLERATNKSSSVKSTIEFITTFGYTNKEAEDILKKIYIRHSPRDGDLY